MPISRGGMMPLAPFNDAPLDTLAQHDPIADFIGAAEIEGDAREDVGQRVLQGQAQDDGEHAGRGDQAMSPLCETRSKHMELLCALAWALRIALADIWPRP